MKSNRFPGVAIGMLVLAAAAMSCSSSGGGDAYRANFFQNPDRTWGAVEVTLIELDYEIESSNRVDGIIEAVGEEGDDGVRVALRIDHVLRVQDEVNVYVKPRDGGGSTTASDAALDRAATAFLTELRKKLDG
mgnify:CR=1 FL=1